MSLVYLIQDTLANHYRTHSSDYIERVQSVIVWLDLLSLHSQGLIELGYDVTKDFTNEMMDEELIKMGCVNINSPIGMDWEEYDEEGGSYYYWLDTQV